MMTPAGFEHGRIVGRISGRLASFVERHNLGVITGAETGFQIEHDPDTVRAPDVAFVRADRVPAAPLPGFFQGAPDLAVEVLSPGDRASDLLAKVEDWLRAGCQAVWVVDPSRQTVSVYRAGESITVYRAPDTLRGGKILPRFSMRLSGLFAL
jgi:Uma2 family endonuclease